MLVAPQVAALSCHDCQRYMVLDPSAQLTARGRGQLRLRPKGTPLPCGTCPKIPHGEPPSPLSAQELTEQNAQAYQHYLECRAVGQWPDDALVRRNASFIRQVEDQVAQNRSGQKLDLIASLLTAHMT